MIKNTTRFIVYFPIIKNNKLRIPGFMNQKLTN